MSFHLKLKFVFAALLLLFFTEQSNSIELLEIKTQLNELVSNRSLERARTLPCKEQIKRAAEELHEENFSSGRYYEASCPKIRGRYPNYLKKVHRNDLLSKSKRSPEITLINKPELFCVDKCLSYGYSYAALSYVNGTIEISCFCFHFTSNEYKNVLSELRLKKAKDAPKNHFYIYETGYIREEELQAPKPLNVTDEVATSKRKRVVYLISASRRTFRQIVRLFNAIHDENHFYYFHIDDRSSYLKQKMRDLEKEFNAKYPKPNSNMKFSNWSINATWCGASFLKMRMKALNDLVELRKANIWHWDYVITLSESDYPIKSVQKFSSYLGAYENGENFLHYGPVSKVIDLLARDVYLWYFTECDEYSWLIGERDYIAGFQINAGSDWMCLHQATVDYLLNHNDTNIRALESYFMNTFCPAEVYFPSVLGNSPFCMNTVKESFFMLNFNDKSYRKGQNRDSIDWLGHSPSFFQKEDMKDLLNKTTSTKFFARKFDPLLNQRMINFVERHFRPEFNQTYTSINSYWLNIYETGLDDFEKIQRHHQLILKVLIQESLKRLIYRHRLIDSNESEDIEMMLFSNDSFVNQLRRISNIHLFFHDNELNGILLKFNLKSNGSFVEFYYRYRSGEHRLRTLIDHSNLNDPIIMMGRNATSISSRSSRSEPVECSSSIYLKYSNNFTGFFVSPQIDVIELTSKNYMHILFDTDNIVAVLSHENAVNKRLDYKMEIFDPDEILYKEFYVKIGFSEAKYGVHSTNEFKTKNGTALKTGKWKLRLILSESDDDDNESSVKEREFLVQQFNVLPSKFRNYADVYSFKRLLADHVNYESFCVDEKSSLAHFKSEKICQINAEWSSEYPDPKSYLH